MRVIIIAVGKVRDRNLRAVIDDYLGRIRHYARCEEVELQDGPDAVLTARLEKAIPERAWVVALEVDGQGLTSRGFAAWLERAQGSGIQSVAFLIGGADGLPAAISARAQLRLSMGGMTLPHRLARLLLAEQVYRGFTILRGEPYDH